jgi:hypothetical protein
MGGRSERVVAVNGWSQGPPASVLVPLRQSGSQQGGHAGGHLFVLITMAGPQEPPEAIPGPPGDDVEMDVRHALAHDFVESEESPLRSERFFLGRCHPAPNVEHRAEEVFGRFRECRIVVAGDNQSVPVEDRAVVEEGHERRLVENEVSRDPPIDDAVKNASFRVDEITL